MNRYLSFLAVYREPRGGFPFCKVPNGNGIECYVVIKSRTFTICVSITRNLDIPFAMSCENLGDGGIRLTPPWVITDLNASNTEVAISNLLVPCVEVRLGSTFWGGDVLWGCSDDIGNVGTYSGR